LFRRVCIYACVSVLELSSFWPICNTSAAILQSCRRRSSDCPRTSYSFFFFCRPQMCATCRPRQALQSTLLGTEEEEETFSLAAALPLGALFFAFLVTSAAAAAVFFAPLEPLVALLVMVVIPFLAAILVAALVFLLSSPLLRGRFFPSAKRIVPLKINECTNKGSMVSV